MTGEISRAVREARRPLRLEHCAWQRAAAGLLVLSVGFNTALYGLLNHQEARHRQEAAQLRSELRTAQQMKTQALQQLGALTLEISRERQALAEQAAAYEALEGSRYIGTCRITAYCPCEACCGRWADGLTATGLPAGPGIAAVDPAVIPLGSTLLINGQKYLAADTGALVQGLHVDLCLDSHEAAEAFGVQEAEVWVVPG